MLDKNEIINKAQLLGWKYVNKTLIKTFNFKDFNQAAGWIKESVGTCISRLEHHPNIMWEYNKVTLICYTYSEGDVTEKDLRLIEMIEKETEIRDQLERYL